MRVPAEGTVATWRMMVFAGIGEGGCEALYIRYGLFMVFLVVVSGCFQWCLMFVLVAL